MKGLKRSRFILTLATTLGLASAQLGCGGRTEPPAQEPATGANLGVEPGELSSVVDNPYVPFASIKRAVYEGKEHDSESGGMVKIRIEAIVRDTSETVAGVKVAVVEVSDFEDGELVEKTKDYYAQHSSGVVYYIGELVDDYEGGKIVGHGGQWVAGENGVPAGVFMPAAPKVGDVFEQERAPGVAEDRSTVLAAGTRITVPAGTYQDCIETEDFDPIKKIKQKKVYCRGVGLVREVYDDGGLIELIEIETR